MAKTIRRAIAILLAATAVILLLLPAQGVNAVYTKGDYVIDGGTLVSYTGNDSDITIPLGITAIGKDAFSGNNNLQKVYISDDVTSIDYAAFENCKNLSKVSIGNGVKAIGQSAFSGCQNLTDINIPKYVETIGSAAFAACPNLSDISVDENNRYFICLDGVLYSKDGKTLYQYLAGRPYSTYQIPEPVKEIDEFCFYGANMLTSVNVVYGVEEIPEYAFLNCTALNQVELPASLKAIRKGAFGGCPNLTKLTVPTSCGFIDDEAFTSMDGKKGDVLNEVTGEVLSESGNQDNNSISETTDSSLVESNPTDSGVASTDNPGNDPAANDNVDNNNPDTGILESISDELGNKDEELGSTIIVGGNAMLLLNPKDMKVRGFDMNAAQTEDSIADSGNSSSTNDDFRATSGRTFDVIAGNMGHYGGSDSDIIIPDEVDTIGNRVFYNNVNINNVVLPVNLKEIGDFAFARSGLSSIDIPYGTEKIGYAAFYNCNNLTNVNIPASVKDIELSAFDGTGFINNWRQIEDGNNFLILGDGILLAYKGHGSEVIIPNSVKQIGAGVFEGNTRMKSVRLPDSLEKIGEDAFNGCTRLSSVDFPTNLEIIEDRAFKDTNLSNVKIPMNVKEIGLGAFDTTLVNGGLETVTFMGSNLPDLTYKPTATRLSATDLRTPAFNGTKYAFIPVNANLDSGTIFSPDVKGFRGEVFSITSEPDGNTNYVQLRKCLKEPDADGTVTADTSFSAGSKQFYLAGVSDSAFDSYNNQAWCNKPVESISVIGDNSKALDSLISDVNLSLKSANSSGTNKEAGISILSSDGSINTSLVNAVLPANTERFIMDIKKDDGLKSKFFDAFVNRYGSGDGVNMYTMSINMTDSLKTTPIKKMATSKIDISMPLPDEFSGEDNIRVATLDDNGLLEEISCEITDVSENSKELSFVVSHLSPFAIFTKGVSEGANEGEEAYSTEATEVSLPQALAANTVNTIAGERVYGTLQKELAPGLPVRYLVITILLLTSGVLFLYKNKRPKSQG